MSFPRILAERAARQPERTALVDDRRRLTYADVAGLAARGVGAGDVVSCILPNRAEAALLFHATTRLGAVLNPILPIHGAREIRFILRQVESTVVVLPDRFRGVDFPALIARLRP